MMAKIEYYLTIGPLEEVEAIVEYDYQPKERQTYNYPGCDEAIDVCGVKIKGVTLSLEMQAALIDALQDDDSLLDQIHEFETYERGEE
jgi:hypothetical protein